MRMAYFEPILSLFQLYHGVIYLNFISAELEQVRTSSNSELAMSGDDILEDVVASYTRTALPNLPEEGVEAVTNYLTTGMPTNV